MKYSWWSLTCVLYTFTLVLLFLLEMNPVIHIQTALDKSLWGLIWILPLTNISSFLLAGFQWMISQLLVIIIVASLQGHRYAICITEFHLLSIIPILKVNLPFLYEIAILLCIDNAFKLCAMSKFQQHTPASCASFINISSSFTCNLLSHLILLLLPLHHQGSQLLTLLHNSSTNPHLLQLNNSSYGIVSNSFADGSVELHFLGLEKSVIIWVWYDHFLLFSICFLQNVF